MNYTDLIDGKTNSNSLKAWINYADLPAEKILTEAEAWIWRRLRIREMQERATVNLPIDASEIDISGLGYQENIGLMFSSDGRPLPYYHEQHFLTLRLRDDDGALHAGRPSGYTIMGDEILLDVIADESLSGEFWYYGTPDPLGAGNLTNVLTDRYPTLLQLACEHRGYRWRKDDARSREALMLALKEIEDINVETDRARRGALV